MPRKALFIESGPGFGGSAYSLLRLVTHLDRTRYEPSVITYHNAPPFEQMKARADVLAPDTTHKIWQDNARFFDKARSGGWRDITAEDRSPGPDSDPLFAVWARRT